MELTAEQKRASEMIGQLKAIMHQRLYSCLCTANAMRNMRKLDHAGWRETMIAEGMTDIQAAKYFKCLDRHDALINAGHSHWDAMETLINDGASNELIQLELARLRRRTATQKS